MASNALVLYTPSVPAIVRSIENANARMEMLIRSTERLVMLMMRASQINLVQIQQQVVVNSSGVVHLTQAMQNNFTSINAAITQNDDALKKAAKQQVFGIAW